MVIPSLLAASPNRRTVDPEIDRSSRRSGAPDDLALLRCGGNAVRCRSGRRGSAQPERRRLADALEIGAALPSPPGEPRGQVVGLEHVVARLGGEKPREIGETDESFLGLRIEEGPAPRMLFRPEEVHPRSEKGWTAPRRSESVVEVTRHPWWIHRQELAVAHLEDHGVAAVETRRLHLDRYPREEPSHGGSLEAALREPFLLPAHRHAVLGGQIVERRE